MSDKTARYRFGDRIEMIAASDANPHKFGFYIRRGTSKAKFNGGSYIEMTDGKGEVWRTPPDNVRPAPLPRSSVQEAAPATPPLGKLLSLASCVEEKVNAEGGEATVSRIVALTVAAINEAAAREAAPATAADGLTETAKRIAWAHWRDYYPHNTRHTAESVWASFSDRSRSAWLSAARAVAPAGVPEGEALSALQTLVGELGSLIDDSEGVSGLHRNGDIAPWSELMSDGAYPWLSSLDDARRIACARPVAELTPSAPSAGEATKPLTHCAAGKDGECNHPDCPQLRDGEPAKSRRHCPLDTGEED